MNSPPKNDQFSLADIAYYLDGVERDRMDAVGASGKTGEVIAIRDLLLQLPDEHFKATIQSVKALVADARRNPQGQNSRERNPGPAAAAALYDDSRLARTGSTGRTVGKVSPT